MVIRNKPLRFVLLSCVTAALIIPAFTGQSASESSDPWADGKTGTVFNPTPNPPENWTYPLLVDFHARDPAYAEYIPASEPNWTWKNEILDIKHRIVNLSLAQQNEYDEARQREIDELQESLQRHQQQFAAEEHNRSLVLYRHHLNASVSGVQGLLQAVDHNPDLNMTIIYAYNGTGQFLAVVGDVETAQWLDDHPFTGALWPADAAPATAALKYAGPTVTIDWAHDSGVSGSGERFAVLDSHVGNKHVALNEVAYTDCVLVTTGCGPGDSSNNGKHGTWVAGVINSAEATQTGAAPWGGLVDIQVAGVDSDGEETAIRADVLEGLNYMAAEGLKYGVHSYGVEGTHGGAGSHVVYLDYYASRYGMLVALPTGNQRAPVEPPCSGYNNICVGGTHDQDDADRSNDVIWEEKDWLGNVDGGSNYGETSDGRKKPDVVAPADTITTTKPGTTDGFVTKTGTSFAAPMLAGIAVLLADHEPDVLRQEAKAIIINTAGDKVEGMWDADWGWGYVHAKNALIVADVGNYGMVEVDHKQTYARSHHFEAGDLITGTITWKRQTTSTCCTYKSFADYDLEVYDPNGNRMDISNSRDENVEHVSVVAPVTGWYQFWIHGYKVPSDAKPLKVAYAIWPKQDIVDLHQSLSEGSTGIDDLTGPILVSDPELSSNASTPLSPPPTENSTNPLSDECGIAFQVGHQYYVRYDECDRRTEAWEETNGCPGLQTSDTDCGPADGRLA